MSPCRLILGHNMYTVRMSSQEGTGDVMGQCAAKSAEFAARQFMSGRTGVSTIVAENMLNPSDTYQLVA